VTSLVSVWSVDGPGPIPVGSVKAVQVTVQCICPTEPPERRIMSAVVLDGIKAGGLLVDASPNARVVDITVLGSPGIFAGPEPTARVSSTPPHFRLPVMSFFARLATDLGGFRPNNAPIVDASRPCGRRRLSSALRIKRRDARSDWPTRH
jgi:hypothetical protein